MYRMLAFGLFLGLFLSGLAPAQDKEKGKEKAKTKEDEKMKKEKEDDEKVVGKKTVGEWKKLISDKQEAKVRIDAVLELIRLGEAAKPLVPAFMEMLTDKDVSFRRLAKEAILKIDPEKAKDLPEK